MKRRERENEELYYYTDKVSTNIKKKYGQTSQCKPREKQEENINAPSYQR